MALLYNGMSTQTVLTKEFLENEYWTAGKSQRSIAEDVGLSCFKVKSLMKRYGIPVRCSGRQKPNLSDRKIGKLTVVCEALGSDKRHPAWRCVCDCGEKVIAYTTNLLKNPQASCSKCGHKRTGVALRKGYKDISGKFWSQIRYSATDRSLSFDVSLKQVWDLFIWDAVKPLQSEGLFAL